MQKNKVIASSVLGLALITGPSMAFAQEKSTPKTQPHIDPAIQAISRADLAAYADWIAAPWTDDDRPYAALRERIDRAAESGQDMNKMMAGYQAAYKAHYSDAKAIFGYYYTAVVACETDKNGGWPYGQRLMTFGAFSGPLIKFHLPHTYNYARLNFICELETAYTPDLKPVGERLFHHDPHDFTVGFYLTNLLRKWKSPQDEAQALNLAKYLAHDNPHRWTAYSLLAAVYYDSWKQSGNKADAKASLVNYRQYLRLAPANRPFRKQAEQYVKELQKV